MTKTTGSSIESVLEAALNRKIVINITYNLKPKVPDTSKPSNTAPAVDIYKP